MILVQMRYPCPDEVALSPTQLRACCEELLAEDTFTHCHEMFVKEMRCSTCIQLLYVQHCLLVWQSFGCFDSVSRTEMFQTEACSSVFLC